MYWGVVNWGLNQNVCANNYLQKISFINIILCHSLGPPERKKTLRHRKITLQQMSQQQQQQFWQQQQMSPESSPRRSPPPDLISPEADSGPDSPRVSSSAKQEEAIAGMKQCFVLLHRLAFDKSELQAARMVRDQPFICLPPSPRVLSTSSSSSSSTLLKKELLKKELLFVPLLLSSAKQGSSSSALPTIKSPASYSSMLGDSKASYSSMLGD